MLSIGEFARYLGVSVRMLRHYDAPGLLVQASADPFTGYRRYTAAQLDRGNRLVALKDLGFALDQIGPVLDAEPSVAELRAMLLLRRAQVSEQLATLDAVDRDVTVLHHGGLDAIGGARQALVGHAEEKRYKLTDAGREIYLHMPMDADPATWVTELQQPVA